MQKRIGVLSQLSARERQILRNTLLGFFVLLFLYFLIGFLMRGFTPAAAASSQAQIAVLVPLTPAEGQTDFNPLASAIAEAARQAVLHLPEALAHENLSLNIVTYDTHGTPDGAVIAALQAARSPNTVAVIGALDARQTLAAAEALRGSNLVMITPSSTAPNLNLNAVPGLYRIPAPDNLQGQAIVEFLVQQLLTTQFLLVLDSTSIANNVSLPFERLNLTGVEAVARFNIDQDEIPEDWHAYLDELGVNTVVITGSDENRAGLLAQLQEAGISFPVHEYTGEQPIAEFAAQHLPLNQIFLIAEASVYAQNIINEFNRAAEERLQIVGTFPLEGAAVPEDLAARISDSEAKAVVYLGAFENAQEILRQMNSAALEIPFVGSDTINTPAMLPLPEDGLPVFYVSPFLNLGSFSAEEIPPALLNFQNLAGSPFAFETIQSVWLISAALQNLPAGYSARDAVWQRVGGTALDFSGLGVVEFNGRQRSPLNFFFYQATEDWKHNPLIFIFSR